MALNVSSLFLSLVPRQSSSSPNSDVINTQPSTGAGSGQQLSILYAEGAFANGGDNNTVSLP